MPVVRELINRISIKLDKGSKKNADNAFDDITKRGQKSANTIKKAFAAIGIGLSIKQVADSITELEETTATAKFFSRSAEEAQRLFDLFDNLADRSELISKIESRRAASTVSSFAVEQRTIEEFLPFLEKIQQARPSLDFDVITQRLGDVIKSGDLQALQDLVPGIKSDLELLSKSSFGKPFGDIREQERATLVLDTFAKNRERLNELAREQVDTVTIEANKLKESGQDFITTFGTQTAPAIRDLLSEINKSIELLNESEGFWNTVNSAIGSISSVLSFIRGEDPLIERISGDEITPEQIPRLQEMGFEGAQPGMTFGELINLEKEKKQEKFKPLGEREWANKGLLGIAVDFFKGKDSTQRTESTQKIEVSGETRIVIEGRNVEGMDTAKMEQIANQVINDKVIAPIRNIRARNGDVVQNGP